MWQRLNHLDLGRTLGRCFKSDLPRDLDEQRSRNIPMTAIPGVGFAAMRINVYWSLLTGSGLSAAKERSPDEKSRPGHRPD